MAAEAASAEDREHFLDSINMIPAWAVVIDSEEAGMACEVATRVLAAIDAPRLSIAGSHASSIRDLSPTGLCTARHVFAQLVLWPVDAEERAKLARVVPMLAGDGACGCSQRPCLASAQVLRRGISELFPLIGHSGAITTPSVSATPAEDQRAWHDLGLIYCAAHGPPACSVSILEEQLALSVTRDAAASTYVLADGDKLPDISCLPAKNAGSASAAAVAPASSDAVAVCRTSKGPRTVPVCVLDATDAMLSQFSGADCGGTMAALVAQMPWLVTQKLSDKASASSLLHCAAARKAPGAVHALLAAGTDVCGASNHKRWTPLHSMAASDTDSSPAGSDVAVLRELLAAGADINAADKHKRSPLWLAAHFGSCELVAAMLAHGADPTVVAGKPRRPLLLACALALLGRDSPAACLQRLRLLLPRRSDSGPACSAAGAAARPAEEDGCEADDDESEEEVDETQWAPVRRRCEALVAAWDGNADGALRAELLSVAAAASPPRAGTSES